MKILMAWLLISSSALAEPLPSKKMLPARAEREQFFAENSKEGLKDFDDLEMDLLYKDLKSKTILELMQKYPELTPKEIEELQTKRK